MVGNFHAFVVICKLYSKPTFSNNSIRNNIRLSNGLDPDHFVVLVWVQAVSKGYQQISRVAASKEKFIEQIPILNGLAHDEILVLIAIN